MTTIQILQMVGVSLSLFGAVAIMAISNRLERKAKQAERERYRQQQNAEWEAELERFPQLRAMIEAHRRAQTNYDDRRQRHMELVREIEQQFVAMEEAIRNWHPWNPRCRNRSTQRVDWRHEGF